MNILRALRIAAVLSISVPLFAADAPTGEIVSVRIRVGIKDKEGTDWSGKLTLSEGKIAEIHGWRWAQGDHQIDANSFALHTRAAAAQGNGGKAGANAAGKQVMDNGIVARLMDVTANTSIEFDTAAGKAKFKISDVPYGKRLWTDDGAIEIERVPSVATLAPGDTDDDYPATAVGKDGRVYVAYLSFTRGKDFQSHRERMATPETPAQNTVISVGAVKTITKPEDFDYLAEPTGGERLLLRTQKDGKWSTPLEVAGGKEELYRPAIAVDGSGKVWVFYSTQLNADAHLDHGDWELMARSVTDGQVSEAINISHAPGTDFYPAAATDSQGRVWVSWVGTRDNKLHVLYSRQDGAGFSEPARVSAFTANEWDPAIAADKNGNVSIAWDTYEKGDYDVYLTTIGGADAKAGQPEPVAATLNFEVRPTIAYDLNGRLWIAWEQSGETWGKDFGALKKMGIPLYLDRSLGIKVKGTDGQWYLPGDVMTAMPPVGKGLAAAKNPKAPRQQIAPTFPRLAIDDQGHVWLAFRGRPPQPNTWKTGVGSIWFEYVTRWEPEGWLTAVWVPHSNNILDNRPALVATPNHEVLMAFSGDGRGDVFPAHVADPNWENPGSDAKPGDAKIDPSSETKPETSGPVGAGGKLNATRNAKRGGAAGPDPNNDIFITRLRTGDGQPTDSGTQPEAALKAIPAEKPATALPAVAEEQQAIKAMHDYRVQLNGKTFQIWRGEFHRHTELSPDGGGDGSLQDLWRYTLDAVALDWIGDGDHDYGNGREYSWWSTQKAVTQYTFPGKFVPMFSCERSVVYPEGHRNVVFAQRGIRSLPRLPLSKEGDFKPAPDTLMLYQYLHHFNGVCAAHTTATGMGTDWRNNDPEVEPFVEIYQGDRNNYERPDAPRSAVREATQKKSTPEEESFGGYKPKGFVNLALLKGYRLAFESSSDHISTHLSFCNVLVTEPTREAILEGMKKRRTYASTANIIADVRSTVGGTEHFMGEEFSTDQVPTLNIKLIGSKKFARVTIIKDDVVVHEVEPDTKEFTLTWTDPKPTPGKTSYYYVRGEQVPDMAGVTGELVWASPMWIKYEGK